MKGYNPQPAAPVTLAHASERPTYLWKGANVFLPSSPNQNDTHTRNDTMSEQLRSDQKLNDYFKYAVMLRKLTKEATYWWWWWCVGGGGGVSWLWNYQNKFLKQRIASLLLFKLERLSPISVSERSSKDFLNKVTSFLEHSVGGILTRARRDMQSACKRNKFPFTASPLSPLCSTPPFP